jgi:hypothetical protein
MMVEPRNIFLRMARGEPQVFLGNLKLKLSEQYIKRTKRNRIDNAVALACLSYYGIWLSWRRIAAEHVGYIES